MINISLTRGFITRIDDEFKHLDQYKWCVTKSHSNTSIRYYAIRGIYLNGWQSTIILHRAIMELKLGRPLLKTEQIDHIDHDGLNNTLGNLRIATVSQNQMNSKKQARHTSSQYKGVTWHKRTSKWMTQIKLNGKTHYLGYFIYEEDAAHAVDAAAKVYFGEYAHLNFPAIS